MRKGVLILALVLAVMALPACGGSSKPRVAKVCNVYPSADGKTLVYSPAGCQHHLKGETLNIETTPAP